MRHHIVRILATVIGVEAVVVMAGWVFGIEWMTRIAPESFSVSMKFTTAFLFLFSSIGLQCMSRVVQDEDELASALLPGIALVMTLVTASMLMGRLLNIPTGIESLFVPVQDIITPFNLVSTVGFPAISTLVSFMLFALMGIGATFLTRFRKELLLVVGGLIGSVGSIMMLGYVVHYAIGSSVPMAFNTAFCFILLGVGIALTGRIERTP